MSEISATDHSHSEDLSSSCRRLEDVLKTCANIQSLESLCPCSPLDNGFNDAYISTIPGGKMISSNPYSFSEIISNSSCGSDDGFTDIVLEEDNRISLAYENLRSIPRRLADKFAAQTKFLDLSYNNFQDLKFLAFFDELHTLILDRNSNLDVNTLPYLPNLRILWINNCDIYNITDWIHRIQRQCPMLEQLSCMGNPGIHTVFKNQCPGKPTTCVREYILQVLPNLKYLDGISRYALSKGDTSTDIQKRTTAASSSCASITAQGHESTSASEKPFSARKITSPTLNIRELFRLRPAKKRNSIRGSSSD